MQFLFTTNCMSGPRYEILMLRHWYATAKAPRSRYIVKYVLVQIVFRCAWCMQTICFLETMYEKFIQDHSVYICLSYFLNIDIMLIMYQDFYRHYTILLILSPFLRCTFIAIIALILHLIASCKKTHVVNIHRY